MRKIKHKTGGTGVSPVTSDKLQINQLRKSTGPIWLDESFDRIVRTEKEFKEKLQYMVHNPVQACLAKQEGEYPHFYCWRP